MRWLILALLLPSVLAVEFSPPEHIPEFTCDFNEALPCSAGTFTTNGVLDDTLILERGQSATLTHDFTFTKGTLTLEVAGLESYNDPNLCEAYWSRDPTNWNSDCPRIHELATFYDGTEEVFSIVATEKLTQYEPASATIRAYFISPDSPYTKPDTGIVGQYSDGVICRMNNLSSHAITLHYDFTTTKTQGISYTDSADYIFMTCNGTRGRPRIMDEIPPFNVTSIVFQNTDPSLPEEEALHITSFAFDNQDIEWCGNGYCALGEESECFRDCGCTQGYLYWSGNTCTTDTTHLEYFGHYRRPISGDYGELNKNPGNLYAGFLNTNDYNQDFIHGNEGADSITHSSFGHGELPLSARSCTEFDTWKDKVTRTLEPHEFAWSVLDEPTGRSHQFSLDAVHYVASGIKNLYPQLQTYVVFNRDEVPSYAIDWIGLDPYHYPWRTSACEEYGEFHRNMYYSWYEKGGSTLSHYDQYNRDLLLVGRSFENDNWDMPSVCQQSWYHEAALGDPNVIGLIMFAWSHPAVIDILELRADEELIQFHQDLGAGYEPQHPEIIQSSIPPGTYVQKNDFANDPALRLPILAGFPLRNGATTYTDAFTVTTSQATYDAYYYGERYAIATPFTLLEGNTQEGVTRVETLSNDRPVIRYQETLYTLAPNVGQTLPDAYVFYYGNDDFLITSQNTLTERGFFVNDQNILPNGNQGHVGQIRPLDPDDFTFVPLDFAQDQLCNGFTTIMDPADEVSALVIDDEVIPVWYDVSEHSVYLAYQQTCNPTTNEEDGFLDENQCDGINNDCDAFFDEYCGGDVNGDAQVTVADISEAAQYFRVSDTDSNWNQAQYADQNGDGVINIIDLITIAASF